MREQLIRYLLGELDDEERRELRALLRDNPELQQELQHLRECFAANQEQEAGPLPPRGLAKRTSSFISNSDEYEIEQASRKAGMSSTGDAPAGMLGWSLADLTVAGGVMLAVSMLVFPALNHSREDTRQTACQHNMIQIYRLESLYADNHDGNYPVMQPHENAGMVFAKLVKEGYVDADEMAVLLKCPASQVARDIRDGLRDDIHVPKQEELRSMSAADLLSVSAKISPCYGIRMPQKINHKYVYIGRKTPSVSKVDPLLGEVSGESTNAVSAHHRGCLIQFVDRSGMLVSIRIDAPLEVLTDLDPFHNIQGKVAAGIGENDVVLAPSGAVPALEPSDAAE